MAIYETEPKPEPGPTEVERALEKIDEAVKLAEDTLRECDEQINEMMERRGRIATQVQNIWNLRHEIKGIIERGKLPRDINSIMHRF